MLTILEKQVGRRIVILMIAALALLICSCRNTRGSSNQNATMIDNVCVLSKHFELYDGRQIQLHTVLLNALPHGLSFYIEHCSVPLVRVAYSNYFRDHGQSEFQNLINAYLVDQVITKFRLVALGHLEKSSDPNSTGWFYIDKVVRLDPAEPPIQPGLKLKDVHGNVIEPQ